jgi:hypothetical protein
MIMFHIMEWKNPCRRVACFMLSRMNCQAQKAPDNRSLLPE